MFIGLAIGTLCIIGLARAASRHHRWHGGFHPYRAYAFGGYHGGCGERGGFDACDDSRYGAPPWSRHERHGFRGSRRGRGRDFVLSMLSRIDATPAQERAILAAIDDLKGVIRDLRGAGNDARADIARAISGLEIDEAAFETASARVDEATVKVRAALRSTLTTIHAVLDERQRKMLADMIGSRWGF